MTIAMKNEHEFEIRGMLLLFRTVSFRTLIEKIEKHRINAVATR